MTLEGMKGKVCCVTVFPKRAKLPVRGIACETAGGWIAWPGYEATEVAWLEVPLESHLSKPPVARSSGSYGCHCTHWTWSQDRNRHRLQVVEYWSHFQDKTSNQSDCSHGCCAKYTLHSLVPRPSLTAFFAAMEKRFFHGCEKSCEGRPGYKATRCIFTIL